MDISKEVSGIIGKNKGQQLEYKPILPPARNIGQLVSAFANSEGGFIILGVAESNGKIKVTGLSEDFNAGIVLDSAKTLMSPRPEIESQYISHEGKRLFAIKILKSTEEILVEGKAYLRVGDKSILKNPPTKAFKPEGLKKIKQLSEEWTLLHNCTGSCLKFIEHYQSVLNIIADLREVLYPSSETLPTKLPEGKILTRILFSSCADNFETYLSDLLFEIYLAHPSTLKSGQQVTVKEVLDCKDIQEFIVFSAKKRIGKLQRGNVKGFITDNNQISDLKAVNSTDEDEIEKILQIRHLYTHNNGIVDEKFVQYFPGLFKLNDTHEMSIDTMLDYLKYLVEIVLKIDKAAVKKFTLSTIS
jgi:hypothetical protein